MMTIEEILEKGEYQDKNELDISEFTINLKVPIFNKTVKIEALNIDSLHIKNKQIEILGRLINKIVEYKPSNFQWIKEDIWKHYNTYMRNTSYGFDYDSNKINYPNEEAWNRAFFNIYSPSDAYESTELELIYFDLHFLQDNFFMLEFACPWEQEHGITICVRNGKFESIR